MDFWTRCSSSEGMSICMTGALIGMILTIILVLVYWKYSAASEFFTDPNDFDPQTKALLALANANDPTSGQAMKKMYGVK